MLRPSIGPLVFQKRELDAQEAEKLLVKEFPHLALFETKVEMPLASTPLSPSSARSNGSSDRNESHSSTSPESAPIARFGSEQSTAATRTSPPHDFSLMRSSSAGLPLRIAKEIPAELSLHHIQRGDTAAIQKFIRQGADPNSLVILNRPIMHFLLINATQNASEFPKALDFFNALLPYVDLSMLDKNGHSILDLLAMNRTQKLKILLQAKETLALLNASKITALTGEIEKHLYNLEEKIKSLDLKIIKNTKEPIDVNTVPGMITAISTNIKKITRGELSNYLPGVLAQFKPVTLISEIYNAWLSFNLVQQFICVLLIAKLLADDVQHDLIIMITFMEKFRQFNKECIPCIPTHGNYLTTQLTEIVNLKSQFQTDISLKNYWFLTENFLPEATQALPPIKGIIKQALHSEAALTHAASTLAHELNALYLSIYKCIRYGEFRDGAWGKDKKGYRAAHLAMLPVICEQLNRFVAQLIFTAEPAEVTPYLTLIVLTAVTLLSPKNGFPPNLFMVSQLIATVAQHDISRLETIFDLLPSPYNDMATELKKFTADNSFKWVRLFEKADPHAPLHIGVIQRDLTVCNDGNNPLSSVSIYSARLRQFISRQKSHMALTCQFSTDFAYQIMQAPAVDYEMQSKKLVGMVVELKGSFKEMCTIINTELNEHIYPRFRLQKGDGLTTFTTQTVATELFNLLLVKLSTEEDIEEADFKMAKGILEKFARLIPTKPVDGNPFYHFMQQNAALDCLKQEWQQKKLEKPAISTAIGPGRR